MESSTSTEFVTRSGRRYGARGENQASAHRGRSQQGEQRGMKRAHEPSRTVKANKKSRKGDASQKVIKEEICVDPTKTMEPLLKMELKAELKAEVPSMPDVCCAEELENCCAVENEECCAVENERCCADVGQPSTATKPIQQLQPQESVTAIEPAKEQHAAQLDEQVAQDAEVLSQEQAELIKAQYGDWNWPLPADEMALIQSVSHFFEFAEMEAAMAEDDGVDSA